MTDVSCIIPVKNRKDMVLRAIESALKQRGVNIEVIVVDDGSTDGSPGNVQKHFPGVRLITCLESRGPGPARNLGAGAASGRVLMFLDSDDLWLEDHCRLLLAEMENSGFPAAYGVTETLDEATGQVFHVPERGTGPSGNIFEDLLRWCHLVPSAFAVTKEAFFAAGGFEDVTLGEDWCLFLRLSKKVPFAFVSQVITLRKLHPGSLCCKEFSVKNAVALLNRLRETAAECCSSREPVTRLEKLLHVTEKEGETCRNVQEWYMTLKRRGLV